MAQRLYNDFRPINRTKPKHNGTHTIKLDLKVHNPQETQRNTVRFIRRRKGKPSQPFEGTSANASLHIGNGNACKRAAALKAKRLNSCD